MRSRRGFFRAVLSTSFLAVSFKLLNHIYIYTLKRKTAFNPNPLQNKNVFKLVKKAEAHVGRHTLKAGVLCQGLSAWPDWPDYPKPENPGRLRPSLNDRYVQASQFGSAVTGSNTGCPPGHSRCATEAYRWRTTDLSFNPLSEGQYRTSRCGH